MSLSDIELKITDTGIEAPEAAAILQEVQNQWNAAFGGNLNLDASTPQGQLITTMAAIIAQQKAELLELSNQFNPLTADGKWQDAIAKIYFISRKPAIATSVECTCMGLAGTVIRGMETDSPAQVQDVNGNIYTCRESVTIGADGTANALFLCDKTGPVECAPETVTTIITVIAGWDIVTNDNAGITGRDLESRRDFEKRRYESVAINASATPSAIYGAVSDIDDVVSVKVLSNGTNQTVTKSGVSMTPHSIFVCVSGGNDRAIAETIYRKLPAGCDMVGTTSVLVVDEVTQAEETIKFQRPTSTNIAFYVRCNRLDNMAADIIKQTIVSEFNGTWKHADDTYSARYGIGDTIYASAFYTALYEANVRGLLTIGIKISDAQDSDPTTYGDTVTLNANQLSAVSASKITVILAS